jgi:hypothetical protein
MDRQVTVTIPENIYLRAERLADETEQNIADLLADVIVHSESLQAEEQNGTPDQAVAREKSAFFALHRMLRQQYDGEYVAVYQGKVIDHDPSFAALYKRVDAQYPDDFVLIRRVEAEPERVYHFRSPRMVAEI